MTARGQHLSDAWYLDHASGTLSLGEQVFMDSHLELSSKAAAKVADYEKVGALILESVFTDQQGTGLGFDAEDIFAQDDAQSGLLDSGQEADRVQVSASASGRSEDTYLPQALRAFVDDNAMSIRWRFLGPKLRKCLLWTSEDGTKLWMLKAEAGADIPLHSHNGSELTLVLKGSFSDQAHRFERGHVQEADDGTEHEILIGDSEECVCLALTQAPLNFANPVIRVFQQVIGI